MENGLKHVQARPHGRLEHIDVTTAQGDPVAHATGRNPQANVARASRDLDWWRTPDTRKGLLHKLVDAIKRKWAGRQG